MAKDKQKQIERRTMMLDTSIPKLIPKMAVPTIIAMMISSIYYLADTYFVHFLGTSATAAVGVNLSIDQAIMMAGSFLAFGANSYIARLMGSNKLKTASQTLSSAFYTAVILGFLVMIPGLMFTDEIVRFLGATDTSAPYAASYATYLLIAAPFTAPSFVLNQCLRSEGSPVFSMIGISSGAILNIALAPLFIFTFNLGIAGAGMAVAISKLISFCILIYPYIRKKTVLRLSLKNINYRSDIVRETTLMGLPSLLRMGLAVVANIYVNKIAGSYSDSAQAATSVVTRIMMLPSFALLGFGQGFQPVAGFNWGAKRYDRVREAFKFSCVVGVIFTAVVSVIIGLFAEQVIQLFTEADAEMIKIGSLCLITQCIAMPLSAWVIVVNMLYAALGKPVGAIFLGITRQGICFIPIIFLLSALFGLDGLAISQGVADLLSFLITIPFAVIIMKRISQQQKSELPLPKPEID
ncbi:MAG: MATE family efflux transporter [Oscillospiraceae bacterium]|nr:MATE family efflux transporter [Oscillospiraceae bacterium]